jgi:hypothetical protein
VLLGGAVSPAGLAPEAAGVAAAGAIVLLVALLARRGQASS